jgi:hypothetical protein
MADPWNKCKEKSLAVPPQSIIILGREELLKICMLPNEPSTVAALLHDAN